MPVKMALLAGMHTTLGVMQLREARALPSQHIQVRRAHPASFESEAISAVLIAHDQQNVRTFQIGGSNQVLTQTTLVLILGLTDCAPRVKALMLRSTSGIGKEPTKPRVLVLVILPAMMPAR